MNNRGTGKAYYITGGMVFALLAMALLTLSCSHTREAAKYEPPTGEKILDRYVEKTGGIENYDKITNRYMEGTLEIPAAGLSLQTQVYIAKPNLAYSLAQADAVGEIRRGTDGKIFWENSLMSGPRILEGEELTNALREAAFDRLVYWRKYYPQAEYIGTDSVDGAPVDKVVITPDTGQPETLYFDQGTGLLIKVESIFKHQMGDLPVEAVLQDYREVDGIMMPFLTKVKIMGQERTMTTTTVKQNIDMPDTLFTVPEDIRELMNNR